MFTNHPRIFCSGKKSSRVLIPPKTSWTVGTYDLTGPFQTQMPAERWAVQVRCSHFFPQTTKPRAHPADIQLPFGNIWHRICFLQVAFEITRYQNLQSNTSRNMQQHLYHNLLYSFVRSWLPETFPRNLQCKPQISIYLSAVLFVFQWNVFEGDMWYIRSVFN